LLHCDISINTMYTLYIQPDSNSRDVYVAAAAAYNAKPLKERDAGFDLYCEGVQVGVEGVTKISQQCVAGLWDPAFGGFRAYYMMPRSSISKTPLRLANSVGIIDAGYRGKLIAAVDNIDKPNVYNIAPDTRLFQICSPDLSVFTSVEVVDVIPGGPTLRGEGGFGSTGI